MNKGMNGQISRWRDGWMDGLFMLFLGVQIMNR